jgi:D-alanine-D-alanine ligase
MSIKVNVLMGGPSAEYEISLRSGKEVLHHLDKNKYEVRAVVIDKSGHFFFSDIGGGIPDVNALSSPESSGFSGPYSPMQSGPVWDGCDVAFLALHGSFGEDGVIQGFLETVQIPYTGSGVFASAAAMNKVASKYLYIQNGISVPPYSVCGKKHPLVSIEDVCKKHGFPCFVKCPQSGSSKLLGRALDENGLRGFIEVFDEAADEILIESEIKGIEFSCGVLEDENGKPYGLPPIEIRTINNGYFDYTAKYTDGMSQEIVPAPRPVEILDRVKETAIAAHNILDCSGVSRTDMIYKDDTLFVLETNTLPGLTSNSLLPKAFKANGGTYSGLLDNLIESAMRKWSGVLQ